MYSHSVDGDYGKIREAFAAYFKGQAIQLPAELLRSGGVVKKGGWDIRYILSEDRERKHMELYAMHRMTNDRHLKIYDDGTVETLRAVSDGVSFKPDVPGDRERAEQERKAKDEPLIADLRQKGLW